LSIFLALLLLSPSPSHYLPLYILSPFLPLPLLGEKEEKEKEKEKKKEEKEKKKEKEKEGRGMEKKGSSLSFNFLLFKRYDLSMVGNTHNSILHHNLCPSIDSKIK
jgi:hypothetical protein